MSRQKVDSEMIVSIAASKLSGALPALDGSALTGIEDVTTGASDPVVSTNPSGGVGSVYLNTSDGEMFVCTDATAGANVWTNVGDGSGDVILYNWGGTAYGYMIGGYAANLGVDRFNIASGTNNVNIGTVTGLVLSPNYGHLYSYHAAGGSSSDTHIYGAGGQGGHGGGHIRSMVSKTQMAASSDSVDSHDLDLECGELRSCNNRTHAYHMGGENFVNGTHQGSNRDSIQKTTFATDVSSTQTGTLAIETSDGGCCSGPLAGYKNGIRGNTTGALQKYVFATDVSATNIGALSFNNNDRAHTCASETHGYVQGGNGSDVIESFLFSNETTKTDVGNLENGVDYSQSCSSTTHGYNMRGTGTNNGTRIQRYSFASQSEDASQTSLTGTATGETGLSNGQE
jgi:hypothetical protein